jgi:spartin
MFPDVESDNGNVGIFFNELPKEELKNLNHTLAQLSDFKESDTNYTGSNTTTGSSIASTAYSTSGSTSGAGPTGSTGNNEDDDKATPTWGSSISEKIDSGVEWLSSALSNGTSKTQDYMNRGGDKVRDNVEPREEPVNVPVPIEKGFHYTRIVSGGVVSVSNFLMMSLAKGTVAVGKKVGTVVAESDFMKDREVNPHISETWKVTKSSVKGAGHVFSDLEESARAIIRGASLETSKTVGHKYGGQVGRISDDGMRTAGNAVDLASTYWNWKTLGIRYVSIGFCFEFTIWTMN